MSGHRINIKWKKKTSNTNKNDSISKIQKPLNGFIRVGTSSGKTERLPSWQKNEDFTEEATKRRCESMSPTRGLGRQTSRTMIFDGVKAMRSW